MDSKLAVIGLTESGKTTYLAALWHLIGAAEVECRLQLDRYVGDLTYLNRIAENWRTFRPLKRTSQMRDTDVTIYLKDTKTDLATSVFFPDIAGESFDQQIEERQVSPSFIANVEKSDGIMLFISTQFEDVDLSIEEFNDRIPPELREEAAASSEGAPASKGARPTISTAANEDDNDNVPATDASSPDRSPAAPKREWTPKDVPDQLKIVQILMDLLRSPLERQHRRVAVILSAWDIVKDMDAPPLDWFEQNLPLVHQYLTGNADAFSIKVYGVSAQGVPLDDPEAVTVASRLPSSERIMIVDSQDVSHDITMPLVWLATSS